MRTTPARSVRWRRHVPFALFAAALALVCFALARPTMSFALPQREGTVILAFDVSNSMRAKDLEPNRIDAAKSAATTFVERQPSSIRIGVVAFGDSAVTVLQPSSVKEDVIAAIKRLSVSGGTSLGQGLYTSLSAIAGKPLTIDESALESDGGAVNIGYFGSSAIVLLSDGENTSRPDPLRVAEVASSAGVQRPRDRGRHDEGNGRSDRRVQRRDGARRRPAEADRPGHRRHLPPGGRRSGAHAGSTSRYDLEFKQVKKPREVTALFAAAGGILLVLGSLLSIVWFGRVI